MKNKLLIGKFKLISVPIELIFLLLLFTCSCALAQDSLQMNRIYNHPYGGQTWGVHVRNNYLYVGNTSTGLYTWDITNPTSPVFRNSISISNAGVVVDLTGTYALMAASASFRILDLTNPAQPVSVTSVPVGYADGFALTDTMVYVSDRTVGIHIYSFSNPTSPHTYNSYSLSGAMGIALEGNRLYCGTSSGQIIILDITNRAAPTLLGSFTVGNNVMRLMVRNNALYVGNYAAGVKILDVSNPASVHTLCSWIPTNLPPSSNVQMIYLYQNILFVGYGYGGIYALDVSNLQTPVILNRYPGGICVYLDFQNNYLYSAEYGNGFSIYQIVFPAQLHLLHPNGGERFLPGTVDTLRWTSNSSMTGASIQIDYNYPDNNWETLVALTPNDGSEPWVVNGSPTTHARIRIVGFPQTTIADTSDSNFTILPDARVAESNNLLKPELSIAYPNPFNNVTTISFSIPIAESTNLDIVNQSGQIIENLISKRLEVGRYSIKWNASRYGSGDYFCRLRYGNYNSTKHIVLVK